MTREREPRLTAKMQGAVGELEELIRGRYPDASFRVVRSPDDGRSVHLLATVDVEDRDEVMDLVVDRVMQLQIEDGLPLHVVPVRTRELAERLLREQRLRPHSAHDVPEDIGVPLG